MGYLIPVTTGRRLRWLFLLMPLAFARNAHAQAAYDRFETEDSYVFMDEAGVAVRMAKRWTCKSNGGGAEASVGPMDLRAYSAFKAAHQALGDLAIWDCAAGPGPVTFSRYIQESQRRLNAVSDKPACAPRIPETGMLNWELLEFDRCLLAGQLSAGWSAYRREFGMRVIDLLPHPYPSERLDKDLEAALLELVELAMRAPLTAFDASCGGTLANVHALVECRMATRKEHLQRARFLYEEYSRRVAALRGTAVIPQTVADGISGDAVLIRRRIRASYEGNDPW